MVEPPASPPETGFERNRSDQEECLDFPRGSDNPSMPVSADVTESSIDAISPDPVAEGPVHALDLHGSGHFSKGSCTGCGWATKGHADDIKRRWDEYHPHGGARVIKLPRRVAVPEPHEREDIQKLEHRIIVLLTRRVDFGQDAALYVAAGVAQARALLIGESDNDVREYVSALMARIAHLSRRQREKLRHPSRNRVEQQRILNDETP